MFEPQHIYGLWVFENNEEQLLPFLQQALLAVKFLGEICHLKGLMFL